MVWNRRNGTLMVALVAALTGCADSGSDDVRRSAHNLSGRVEGEGSLAGTVSAHEVSDDGEPVPASEGESTTSASGEFTVAVNVESGSTTTVLVEATVGQTRRAAIVESSFSSDATVEVEPMTLETTFESDVYVQALADGELCDGCTSALVLDFVGSGAAEANGGAATSATLEATIDLAADASESLHAALAASADSSAELRTALRAHMEARLVRASALLSASSDAEIRATEEAYLEAVADAYVEAGIDLDEQIAAAHAEAESARAKLETLASLEASVRASLAADIELHRAALVTFMVEAQASVAGASSEALGTAGDTLRASLSAAADAGASADAQIDAAWDAYRVSVRATLRASLEGAQQTAFDAVLPALEAAAATTRASLSSTYSATVTLGTWIDPILGFSASVDAQADALVAAGVSETEASAMLQLLVAVELAGG